MKSDFLSCFASVLSLSFAVSAAPPLTAVEGRESDPRMLAIGREPARGEVIPYASAADADAGVFAPSLYLQPLEGWKVLVKVRAVADADSEGPRPVRQGQYLGSRSFWRTSFKVPFAWVDREVFAHIGWASASYDVWVNGKLAGYSQNGGGAQEFNLTKYVVEGNNSIEVVIYDESATRKLEDYTSGTSLKLDGRCYIFAQPRVRVRDVVTETSVERGAGLFSLGVVMKSHLLNPREVQVLYELVSASGEVVSSGKRGLDIDMRQEDTVRFFANIPGVKPWSASSPELYNLRIRTSYEGKYMEYLSFRVGFRTVETADGMLRVNGQPVQLTIAEYAPEKAILTREDEVKVTAELTALKDKGANMIWVRNHPQQENFYSLCDRLGIYVCDQANIDTRLSGTSLKLGGNPSNDPVWCDAYVDRVVGMYHNAKRHPSVVMFSLARESANGYNLYESYLALKRLEPLRPVIYPDAGGQWDSDVVKYTVLNK